MARPKKTDGEIKDQRVPIVMSPSELKELDDWMHENRIRSRGEAIRRLCHIGMASDRRSDELTLIVRKAMDRHSEEVMPLLTVGGDEEFPNEDVLTAATVMMDVITDLHDLMSRLAFDRANAKGGENMQDVLAGAAEIESVFKKFSRTRDKINALTEFGLTLKRKKRENGDN